MTDLEWARDKVQSARDIEAQGGTFSPNILEHAEAILRAAGIDPNSITAEVGTPGPRTRVSQAEGYHTLLGIGPNGEQLSAEHCKASSADPLTYLSAEGITLTAEGRQVRDMLAELPRGKALRLKINVTAVDAYAKANGIDPDACLKAEIDLQEELQRRRGPEGPAQPAPRDEQLEADEALAGRFGLKF